jgi:hypothetical protein
MNKIPPISAVARPGSFFLTLLFSLTRLF